MIAGLPLGFAEPLVLLGLISLPALWWCHEQFADPGETPAEKPAADALSEDLA